MSERFGSNPPDEPIIGADYPPAPLPPPSPRGLAYIGGDDEEPAEEYAEDWDEEGYDEYGDDDQYYGDEYYEDTPARQPMFYVFIGMAALIGGLMIFLLFTLFNSDGNDDTPPVPKAGFNIQIDSPRQDSRLEVGKTHDVAVSATSNEQIAQFELLLGGQVVDRVVVTSQPLDKGFRATAVLRLKLNQRGNYDIIARVQSAGGATKDSAAVRVIGYEGVGDKPQTIKGKVQTDVNVRTGPGENYELVKTLKAGEEVTVIGKTTDREWLLIQFEGQDRWVKRSAIQEQDSLDLVRTTNPTPRPEPTATNTPVPSPSPSRSPSPSAAAPDFSPNNAALIDGGAKLRVTVANQSTNNFNGSLVVSVAGVNPGTLTQAFAVNIPAGGSATVDFELNPPVTAGGKTAQVKVDPDNAIKEQNEDNNSASFGLQPASEQPELVIQTPVIGPTGITVTIQNNGGPLPASSITVRITVGQSQTSKTQNIALAKGQSATFTDIAKPGTGTGTVEVVVGGQTLKSVAITLQ